MQEETTRESVTFWKIPGSDCSSFPRTSFQRTVSQRRQGKGVHRSSSYLHPGLAEYIEQVSRGDQDSFKDSRKGRGHLIR